MTIEIKTIDGKNFEKRTDLENEVGKLTEKTPTLKSDFEIKGTTEELARLGLSQKTMVYGIKCVATDFVEIKKENKEKPSRGKLNENYKLE